MEAFNAGTIEQPFSEETARINEESIRQEKETQEELKKAEEAARVKMLDPDFIIILLLALFIDTIDLIITVICIFVDLNTITESLIIVFIDLPALLIIGGWIGWRTGKKSANLKKLMEQRKEVIKKTRAAFQKNIAKTTLKSPRAFARAGITFIAEIIPIIGALPIWTISVALTLRQK